LADGTSTLDLFGREFVLLRLGRDAPAGGSLVDAAAQRGVPLRLVSIDEAAVSEVYEMALVLVRPDGHVAWRSDTEPAAAVAAAVVDIARGAGAQPPAVARQLEVAG
jgi:hypothetical protein